MIKKIFFFLYMLTLSTLEARYNSFLLNSNNILSSDSNPSLISMYPMQKIYSNQVIWSIREHNFKEHFNPLVSNFHYLLEHQINGTSAKEVEQQKNEFLNLANKTSDILYSIKAKGSSFYKVPIDSYIGMQWQNISFSVSQKSIHGVNLSLGQVVDEEFLKDASSNKTDYAFWKTKINAIKDDSQNALYVNKSKASIYALSYANNIHLAKKILHFGLSLKYMDADLYQKQLKIHQLSYEQLMLYLDSKVQENAFKRQNIFSGDIGVAYQSSDGKFAIGYLLKDFYYKNLTKEDNSTKSIKLFDKNATLDLKHVVSIYYKYSKRTLVNVNIDLMPSEDMFGNISNQYADFVFSQNVRGSDILSLGVKIDRSKSNNNPFYTIGYKLASGRASFDVDYEFSEKHIYGENKKQQDVLRVYFGYRF